MLGGKLHCNRRAERLAEIHQASRIDAWPSRQIRSSCTSVGRESALAWRFGIAAESSIVHQEHLKATISEPRCESGPMSAMAGVAVEDQHCRARSISGDWKE